ncbi:MAG: hypothetical protein SFV15_13525 [Polyangiaceae bacterium]|nr:hypothetical protein [Polyangiaceae bacterium]
MNKRMYWLGVGALALFGCSDDDHHSEPVTPSGAVCAAGSTLTYESFGKTFMQTYCTSCHSSALSGTSRSGAPSDHDFDTVGGIRSALEHIDSNAAAGPLGTNTAMPPGNLKPSLDERKRLGEWLACGAP